MKELEELDEKEFKKLESNKNTFLEKFEEVLHKVTAKKFKNLVEDQFEKANEYQSSSNLDS